LPDSADDQVASPGSGALTRRRLIQGIAFLAPVAMFTKVQSTVAPLRSSAASATDVPLRAAVLPAGIRSRFVNNIDFRSAIDLLREGGARVRYIPMPLPVNPTAP